MKIGRNDPCWCGSGKKYKKCHLGRANQDSARPWELDALMRARTKSGECLHAGTVLGTICGKPAIGSHTIPKKMLKQIARKGHVYYHSASIQDLEKSDGRITVKLIGVNEASVLPVFCHPHDSGSFVKLEQAAFTGDSEQCFLLAYRPLCNEYSKKREARDSVPAMKDFDRGKPLEQQIEIQRTMDALAQSYAVSMRDLDHHKQKFDSICLSHDYSDMRAYIVYFDRLPEILCAGIFYPECDFTGRPLQDLGDVARTMELITFSLIATETGGAFVLAWDKTSDGISRQFADSLDRLADADVPHAILRFVFEFSENHYISPDWWESVDESIQNDLTDRFQVAASVWEGRSSDCLRDDGVRAVSWTVTGRTWL